MTAEEKEDTNDPFVAWLYEFEGYGQRIERLSEDLRDPLDKLMPWLRAAYEVGKEDRKEIQKTLGYSRVSSTSPKY